jgi:hypothetical protein
LVSFEHSLLGRNAGEHLPKFALFADYTRKKSKILKMTNCVYEIDPKELSEPLNIYQVS